MVDCSAVPKVASMVACLDTMLAELTAETMVAWMVDRSVELMDAMTVDSTVEMKVVN